MSDMTDMTIRKPQAQSVLETAVQSGARVIHIEPNAQAVTIRYRRGSTLESGERFSLESGAVLIKQIKRLAKIGVRQKLAPQQGQYELTIAQQPYRIEVVTAPIVDGEKLTLHIQSTTIQPSTLVQLGWWGSNLVALQQALAQPHGLIVVAGRQTQHLQTTLLTLAQTLRRSQDQLVYIGNTSLPKLDGIEAITTNTRLGRTIDRLLGRYTRSNHQIILADLLTTRHDIQAAVAAAKAKKLVIIGVPGGNATDTLIFMKRASRLTTGIGLIRLSAGQLFVPRLCEHCQEPYEPSRIELQQLDDVFHIHDPTVMRHLNNLEMQARQNGVNPLLTNLGSSERGIVRIWHTRLGGCEQCHYTGYFGEVGLVEATPLTSLVQQQLVNNAPTHTVRQGAIDEGMLSLEVDGLIKLFRGLIDLPTLLRICQ